MTTPLQPTSTPNTVPFFVVIAPGRDPSTFDKSSIHVEVQKLHWKFADIPEGELIDLAKQVDDNIKALEKWCEAARGVLKQRLPAPAEPGDETVTRGRLFEAHYVHSTRTALDQERVKAHFGADLPNWCKTTPVFTLKIVPIPQTPGVAG